MTHERLVRMRFVVSIAWSDLVLSFNELYRMGERVYGEKSCHKGIARLVKDEYLVRTKLGRKMLFGLHPRITQLLPLVGAREHQDEAEFAAALESEHRVIVARRNKRRAWV
jgi:hypothetical protein